LIKEVKESKFLGVLIDKRLSWQVHINKVKSQIKGTIGIIGREIYEWAPTFAFI